MPYTCAVGTGGNEARFGLTIEDAKGAHCQTMEAGCHTCSGFCRKCDCYGVVVLQRGRDIKKW